MRLSISASVSRSLPLVQAGETQLKSCERFGTRGLGETPQSQCPQPSILLIAQSQRQKMSLHERLDEVLAERLCRA
jgi:hypothetical protein